MLRSESRTPNSVLDRRRSITSRRSSSMLSSSDDSNTSTSQVNENMKGMMKQPREPSRTTYTSFFERWPLLFRAVEKKPPLLQRLTTRDELELVARQPTLSSANPNLQHSVSLPSASSSGESEDDEISSQSSLSTVDDLPESNDQVADEKEVSQFQKQILNNESGSLGDDEKDNLLQPGRVRIVRFSSGHKFKAKLLKEVDVEEYMARREMTRTQERWNALTMIPFPVYCLYYLFSGAWIQPDLVEEMRQTILDELAEGETTATSVQDLLGDFSLTATSCIHATQDVWDWLLQSVPAMPPLPLLFVAMAFVAHTPFSFIYHWKYAHALKPSARTQHWSRRMDQSMIHWASACLSYATSGSWDFFIANLLYNVDSVYRQFKPKVRPRRNQIRIFISIVAYTLPILRRGNAMLFAKLWLVLGFSAWVFAQYPIGGWSHSAFHVIMILAVPLLMEAALELPTSQAQLRVAATCAALEPVMS